MERRRPVQLELPAIVMTAAQRKQWVRDRLHGFEYRQAVREAKRRTAIERRKRVEAAEALAEKAAEPRQVSIPAQFYRRVN